MTELPDFSGRDDAIRHLTYTPLRRREGVPHELFDAYWRDVHGPLCARLPGLGYYVQHHFDRRRSANLWPLPAGVERMDAVLDGMVEIGFADREDQRRFEEASPLLFADERNFIGHDVAYALPRGSRTLVDRDPDPTPNRKARGHHLHVHLSGEGDAFASAVRDLAEDLAGERSVVKVRLHLPDTYDNADPAPAAPEVDHLLPEGRRSVALLEVAWTDRILADRWLSGPAQARHSDALAATVGSIGAFLVEGTYTYIRDGILTTAGLRGSRAAMLIEALGATNQVSEQVACLFLKT